MVTGEHHPPEGTGPVRPEGWMRISMEAIWEMNTGEDAICMILYRVQNKLSPVGGHYGARIL